ncbi:MAG: 16S rRNA (cytosine(1402)-N(4))-methyltransferase RsmH [Candidatus Andersenbacteria bacterium]
MSEHIPVLVEEVLEYLTPDSTSSLLDATIGLGGHAEAYLKRAAPGGYVVGLDADAAALKVAQERLAAYTDHFTLLHTNFSHLKDSVTGGGILYREFSHVLFDLGVGSHQLADSERSFSFLHGGGLSMRYGESGTLPPAKLQSLNWLEQRLGHLPDVLDLLTGLTVRELTEVLRVYGEERLALRVAKALKESPLPHTGQALVQRITEALPGFYERGRIHPATRTFQALRLSVNRELEVLEHALPQAVEVLKPGGTMAVISFHSLEDRIVKQFFRAQAQECICPPTDPVCHCDHTPLLKILTKKPVVASLDEVAHNPRARSAKLRAAQKIP